MSWLPSRLKATPRLRPGFHEARLLNITETATPKKRLPIVRLQFAVGESIAQFDLVFGAHPYIDALNGKVIEDLYALLGEEAPDNPDWRWLTRRFSNDVLEIQLLENPKNGAIDLRGIRALEGSPDGTGDEDAVTEGREQLANPFASGRTSQAAPGSFDDLLY